MDFDKTQRERQQAMMEEFGEHTFMLRGESFQVGRNIPYVVLRDVAGVQDGSSDYDAFKAVETAVLGMLASAEDRARFMTVVENTETDFPITYTDLLEIHNWMLREATRRPPTQDESSSDTSSKNGSDLTATSSSAPDAP